MPLSAPLARSVIVITGASSGIGATTALRLARRGASLMLTARGESDLLRVAEACRRRGAAVAWLTGDIAEESTAERVAVRAEEDFGRIDGWVNNAGVALYCSLLDVPVDEVRRVLDVDVLGMVHGVQAAVPRLRTAGGGVIVNVASVLGTVTAPWLAPYNAAKHAVVGLSATLRQELRASGDRSVSVCTVLPAAIDTPLYEHAANRVGHPARALSPAYRPTKVAAVIENVLERPRRHAYAGTAGRLAAASHAVAPSLTERILTSYGNLLGLDRHQPAPPTTGNLYTPHGSRPDPAQESR
jgi:short-subunit dehydrogenase